jgi:hypothetical protein
MTKKENEYVKNMNRRDYQGVLSKAARTLGDFEGVAPTVEEITNERLLLSCLYCRDWLLMHYWKPRIVVQFISLMFIGIIPW